VNSWVTIGGFSLLDGANVSNITSSFVVFKDWKIRGTALDQDKIISSINRELAQLQEAQAFVLIPRPSGDWADGRLPDDGGGPGQPRPD